MKLCHVEREDVFCDAQPSEIQCCVVVDRRLAALHAKRTLLALWDFVNVSQLATSWCFWVGLLMSVVTLRHTKNDPSTRLCEATPGVGHYTQIVWKSTLRVGCSMAQDASASFQVQTPCAKDRRVVVCHYDPGGNVRGKYFSQVVPPLATFADPDAEMRCGGPVSELQI
eukprot:540823-Amphidinium_carterae.1